METTLDHAVPGPGLAWWVCLRWNREAGEEPRLSAKYPSGHCCGLRVDRAGGNEQMLKVLPSNQTVDQVEVRSDQQKLGGKMRTQASFCFCGGRNCN